MNYALEFLSKYLKLLTYQIWSQKQSIGVWFCVVRSGFIRIIVDKTCFSLEAKKKFSPNVEKLTES